ncbi:MAG TPA: DUF4388 domain-containing protein [Polyangiaceae bacterium]|nr:DUF4388 domain-containing protein [Polyangiaceae bacterium]
MAPGDPDDNRATKIEATRDTDPVSANGFRARLEGLSLFDLVQMECLARARRCVRVVSAGRVGYLFFKDGEIFHATTKTLVGERAAQEMLGWTDGTFEPCNIAWPERPTVKMSWQNLLLGAATQNDEQAAGKLVHLPSRRAAALPAEADDVTSEAEELPRAEEPSVKPNIEPASPSSSPRRAVRIDAAGNVLGATGEASELAGFAAYAARVGELVGQSLGLGKFAAMDVAFESTRTILCVEEGGKVVVIEGNAGEDLATVARSVGL